MSHARTIDPHVMTSLMFGLPHRTHLIRRDTLVSFALNATHPYERLGKHMRDEIYARCDYRISYGTEPQYDRIHVHHGVYS